MAGDYLPPAVLDSRPGFLLRLETQRDYPTAIALGDEPGSEVDPGAFIFDILVAEEFFSATFVADPGLETLARHLDPLHERAWTIFESAKTKRLERLLGGEST